MVAGVRDAKFGGSGSQWSLVPFEFRFWHATELETHFVGGYAMAVHELVAGWVTGGTPVLVVWGWTYDVVAGANYRTVSFGFWRPGAREEDGIWVRQISEPDRDTDPLDSCLAGPSSLAILVREAPPEHRPGVSQFALLTVGLPPSTSVLSPLVTRQSVQAAWLHEPDETTGNARIGVSGNRVVIASTRTDRLRVTVLTGTTAVTREFTLGGATGILSGLVRLDVASVGLTTTGISLALTAHRNEPFLGGVSQGAILRLLADGSRDSSFGDQGLWVTPLTLTHRQFRCVGETPRGLAGFEDRRAVAYAMVADGGQSMSAPDTLDQTFGILGIAEIDLGAGVSTAVVGSDANWIYLFAHRVPDGRIVGCRWARGSGSVDTAFGSSGVATVSLEEPGLVVRGIAIGATGGYVFLAVTRSTKNIDCERLPTVVALDRTSGARVSGITV